MALPTSPVPARKSEAHFCRQRAYQNCSGIGQYTAYAFAKHGVRQMALTDLRPENLQKTVDELKKISPETEVLPIQMNTADEKQVFDSVAQTVQKFGSLDIAVNNAGRGGPGKATHELETKDFQSLIDVNLTGVWLCQKAQIQQMLKQEYVGKFYGRFQC